MAARRRQRSDLGPRVISALMAMFSERILGETPELDEEGVKMRFLGRREGVSPVLLEQMRWAAQRPFPSVMIAT